MTSLRKRKGAPSSEGEPTVLSKSVLELRVCRLGRPEIGKSIARRTDCGLTKKIGQTKSPGKYFVGPFLLFWAFFPLCGEPNQNSLFGRIFPILGRRLETIFSQFGELATQAPWRLQYDFCFKLRVEGCCHSKVHMFGRCSRGEGYAASD